MANISWLVWPIAAPLALGLAAFVLGGRWNARLGAVAAGSVVMASVAVTGLVWSNGPQSYLLGNWPAPLGITLHADGLACAMLLMSAVVGAVVSVYSLASFGERKTAQFWPLWLLLWSALNALFLSADLFNLYVSLELLTLAGVGLVVTAGSREATEAALRYLLVALAGSLLYLAGVIVMYGAYGTLDVSGLGAQAMTGPPSRAALLLIMLGLMLKTALFPFHFWLPPAHGSAPSPVSSLLSGLVVKASYCVLLRLWFELFPAEVTQPMAMLPAALGSAAIAWGSLQALLAERLKKLLAYSTVAQVGYLFLIFGVAQSGSDADFAGWSAGVLFALSHALAKGSLFLAAGTILQTAGHDRIRDLAAVARQMPVTFFAMGLASVSLMGLPPTAAFVAKWTLLQSALARGRIELAVIVVGGGLLAAMYLFRVLSAAFVAPREDDLAAPIGPAPRILEYSALVLAFASLVLGLFSWPIIELLQIGSPWAAAAVEGAAL